MSESVSSTFSFSPLPHRGRGSERSSRDAVKGCLRRVKSFKQHALHKHPLTLALSPDGERGKMREC